MSNANVLPVGTKIRRISDGTTGTIFETNEDELAKIVAAGGKLYPSRRRIKWDHNKPRTWIAIKDLVGIS